MSFSVLYVTYPNEEEARNLTDHLIEKKLVAGVNLFPIESAYWWKNAVQREGEWVSIMQTSDRHWKQIVKTIEKLHSYEVPCIIRLNASANRDYEKWVDEETRG